MARRKEAVITPVDSQGKDELWCEWFKCPACAKANIWRGCNYCPDCGIRIRFGDDLGSNRPTRGTGY